MGTLLYIPNISILELEDIKDIAVVLEIEEPLLEDVAIVVHEEVPSKSVLESLKDYILWPYYYLVSRINKIFKSSYKFYSCYTYYEEVLQNNKNYYDSYFYRDLYSEFKMSGYYQNFKRDTEDNVSDTTFYQDILRKEVLILSYEIKIKIKEALIKALGEYLRLFLVNQIDFYQYKYLRYKIYFNYDEGLNDRLNFILYTNSIFKFEEDSSFSYFINYDLKGFIARLMFLKLKKKDIYDANKILYKRWLQRKEESNYDKFYITEDKQFVPNVNFIDYYKYIKSCEVEVPIKDAYLMFISFEYENNNYKPFKKKSNKVIC